MSTAGMHREEGRRLRDTKLSTNGLTSSTFFIGLPHQDEDREQSNLPQRKSTGRAVCCQAASQTGGKSNIVAALYTPTFLWSSAATGGWIRASHRHIEGAGQAANILMPHEAWANQDCSVSDDRPLPRRTESSTGIRIVDASRTISLTWLGTTMDGVDSSGLVHPLRHEGGQQIVMLTRDPKATC